MFVFTEADTIVLINLPCLNINYSGSIKMDSDLSLGLKYLWIWKFVFSHVKTTFLYDFIILHKFIWNL